MALLLCHATRIRSVVALLVRPWHSSAAIHSNESGVKVKKPGGTVTLGDVTVPVSEPESWELVPMGYVGSWDRLPQSHLRHIKWLMQKEAVGQDVFLIGPPGHLRRVIAMQYLELTKKECEFVSLSRDTTENDLKQRREIKGSTAFYLDQAAVRAAVEGRVLVLEGIDKAERNVLPILNNLLENREMQLDDGRFLVAGPRYDELLLSHSRAELDSWRLLRVSEDFRVIALGHPVPKFPGNALDPPLRSRFQARDVGSVPFQERLDQMLALAPSVSKDRLTRLLSFVTALQSKEVGGGYSLLEFPFDLLPESARVLNNVPSLSAHTLVKRIYPYEIVLKEDSQNIAKDALKTFNLLEREIDDFHLSEIASSSSSPHSATVTLASSSSGKRHAFDVPMGTKSEISSPTSYVTNAYHESIIGEILQSHAVRDFCLIGPKGCGKTEVVSRLASALGYETAPILLYADMTSRDLLQTRTTNAAGDTVWIQSSLVRAAVEGRLAVLDGIHRLHRSTLATLARLVHDRETTLFDGTRIMARDKYDAVARKAGWSETEMNDRRILPIHPSFRIVALAEPPITGGTASQAWLNAEQLSLFFYHQMRPLGIAEELDVITKSVPNLERAKIEPLLRFTQSLRDSRDPTLKSLSTSLSTRQLLRTARQMASFPDAAPDLRAAIEKSCLSRFLPSLAKNALDASMEKEGIEKRPLKSGEMTQVVVKDGLLIIGATKAPLYESKDAFLVPDKFIFYENAQHLRVLEAMLQDFQLGEHLLLVGNQGVGKNKIVDRFLQLLRRPREYVQLHRDTTVQSLTLQPKVSDGVITYEDSPLVRAVKNGYVLVVDEADKAPTHVTCVLKTLVESGSMILGDGRRILPCNSKPETTDEDVIVTRPDFRMIVLANRPGFPFLGNDFFASLGDLFSAHAIDNPDLASEMQLLRSYGPNLPEEILKKLVMAFGELRGLADQGQIAYPYSTREVVNIVRHLQRFSHEGLASVVRNVIDFDAYNEEMKQTVIDTLHKHGIPLGAHPANVLLARDVKLPPPALVGRWNLKRPTLESVSSPSCQVSPRHVVFEGPARIRAQQFPLELTDRRATEFTEEKTSWTMPLHETNIMTDVVAVSYGVAEIVHVAAVNPISVMTSDLSAATIHCTDLWDFFPRNLSAFKPRARLAGLPVPYRESVVVHEEVTGAVHYVTPATGDVTKVMMLDQSVIARASNAIRKSTMGSGGRLARADKTRHRMVSDFSSMEEHGGLLAFYQDGESYVDVLRFAKPNFAHRIQLPFGVVNVKIVSPEEEGFAFVANDAENGSCFLVTADALGPLGIPSSYGLQELSADSASPSISCISATGLTDELLSKSLDSKISCPNRLIASTNAENALASVALGFPELMTSDIYSWPRPEIDSSILDSFNSVHMDNRPTVVLPDSALVVRAIPKSLVPLKEAYGSDNSSSAFGPRNVKEPGKVAGFLEVVHVADKKLTYIPVPPVERMSSFMHWLSSVSDVHLVMSSMPDRDTVVTVDAGGSVRLWETSTRSLTQSLENWRKMIGAGDAEKLELLFRDSGKDATGPKIGKFDEKNEAHVGGNTWAGGSGGRDTAGLGGKGGPFRLDSGHQVHQLSDAEKEAVPEEVKIAAREMAEKAFRERLKEIQMSAYDAEQYEEFSGPIRKQVTHLRNILESLHAKGKERQWLKHQAYGDLDESKLVEGLTGEKAIYKRRGEHDPEPGTPQEKPKRLKLVVDVSGSMYRFNGVDGRLDREMEAILMLMEALESYEQKICYDVVGHSGEGYDINFVSPDSPPKHAKDRLEVLKTMHAHSQFCLSGDYTLPATKHAIDSVTEPFSTVASAGNSGAAFDEADEYFVIVLSDANFSRYGISHAEFGRILTSDPKVNAFAVFIGSLGDQAYLLQQRLPAGRAFVCMDTKDLPKALQQIFTSSLLYTP